MRHPISLRPAALRAVGLALPLVLCAELLATGLQAASPLGATAAAFAPSPSAAAPQTSEFQRLKDKAKTDQIKGLEELADYAHKSKAFLQRDQVYESLIVLDPEHADARKWLKYKKDRKTGKWVQAGYRAPKFGDDEIVTEISEKRLDLDALYVDTIMNLVEEHEEAIGMVRRKKELQELLGAAPDNERVREAMGYVAVESGGKRVWKSRVVVETEEARARIQEELEKRRGEVPELETSEPREEETKWGVDWSRVYSTENIRVVGNSSEIEMETVTKHAHMQYALLDDLFGKKGRYPRDMTIYLIDGDSAKNALLDNYPELKEEDRKYFKDMQSAWLAAANRVGCWPNYEEGRIDVACKQMSGLFLRDTFSVTSSVAWVYEGFGQYVNQLICGTRLHYTVTRTEYADPKASERDLGDPDADWFEMAKDELDGAPATRLVTTLGKGPNEMTPGDIVLSYTLAAYLIEGHGRRMVADILTDIGKGEASSTVVLEKHMGMTLPDLQKELEAWIKEVGNHDY